MRPVAATRGTSPLLPVLTLLCALGFAAPPHGDAAPVSGNITLSFTSNTLDVAALWLLNVVNKRNLAFSVPPQEMTGVKVGDMRVENITAGSLSLKMMSPNKISVVLQNVSANSRNASFKIDAPLIHRTGNFSISPREANFSFVVSVVDDVGKRLKVSLDDTKLELKDLGLKYWLDSVEKSTHRGDIIRTLLEKCAILIMQHNVPDVMKSVVEKNLNSGLATLPILLAGDPNVTSERAVLSFTVLGNETVNESSSAASDPLQPPLPDRDIAVVASFAALNNLMRLAVNRTNVSLTLPIPSAFNTSIVRAMYPEVYALCPDCPFALSVALKAAPQVSARPESLLVLNATNCSLTLLTQPPKGDAVSALDVLLSADVPVMELAFVDEAHLRTKLGPMNLTIDVLSSVIRPIFTDTLEGDLQWIIDRVLIPILNGNTAGIPLPFKLSKPVLNVTDSQVVFGANGLISIRHPEVILR